MITGKVLGEKYIIDGIATDTSDFKPDMSADIYYEVIRLMGGKFLFLDDHNKRLRNSLHGTNLKFPGFGPIQENLRELQIANSYTEGNIRICIQQAIGSGTSIICYFIPYLYPEACMYKSGVQVVTYPHVRPNPGIKKWDDAFRVAVNDYIREYGVYEAVLLNTQKQVTEGSRSNIFFLDHHHHIITAPEQDVLPGITRNYVLSICKQEGIEVFERPIHLAEINTMTSCFISGTSPKILPVWQLDGIQFKVDHPLLNLLMERYELLLNENLTSLIQA